MDVLFCFMFLLSVENGYEMNIKGHPLKFQTSLSNIHLILNEDVKF